MRNLKRALSLVMAAAMLIGMMVVGASAGYDDFTDKDEIVNTEAVSTLVSLGVIAGKEDGSYYDPTGIVTRAEMAKMITVALNGGVEPVLGTKANPSFSDIKGTWAESYIEYCTNMKIISGRGDGTFDPTATVTGTEAAKMILVALGYSSDVFGFTGAKWADNVTLYANDPRANLFKGLSGMSANAGLTRDNAAQMIYNGIVEAQMLVMEPSESITNGNVTFDYHYSDSMLKLKFDSSIYVGVITGNEYATVGGGIQKAGEYRFQAFLQDDEPVSRTLTVAGNTTPDMLGKSYQVIIKDTQKAGVYNVVYGDPVLSDMNRIYTVSSNKTLASGTTAASFENDVKAAGISGFTESVSTGSGSTTATARTYEDFDGSVTQLTTYAAIQAQTANGKIIEVVDNDNDGVAEFVLVSTPFIGKVTAYNAEGNNGEGYITVSNKGDEAMSAADAISGAKFEKVVGVENLAKDDIVSWMTLNEKFYVTKLETVTGIVTAETGNNEIKLDGVTYKESSLGGRLNDDNVTVLKDATALGKEAVLYLDASGYVVYTKAADDTRNYLYVDGIEVGGSITGVTMSYALADGTTGTAKIDSVIVDNGTTRTTYKGSTASGTTLALISGGSIVAAADPENRIAAYGVNSDGSYTLTLYTASEKAQTTGATITKGNASIAVDGGAVLATSSTVFMLKDGDNYTVYTGINNVPTMTNGGGNTVLYTVIMNKEGTSADMVVVTSGAPSGDTKSVYILSQNVTVSKNAAGDDVYTVPAVVDGAYVESLVLDGYTGTGTVTSGLYSIGVIDNSVKYSMLSSAVNFAQIASGDYVGNVLKNVTVPGGTATLTLTSDTKFIIISGSTADKVILDGTADDIIYQADDPNTSVIESANNSKVIASRVSNTPTDAGYNLAAYVYIFR